MAKEDETHQPPSLIFSRRTISALLGKFDICLAQSQVDAERFAALGSRNVVTTGNLKLDAAASFAGTVAGMSGKDTVDLAEISFARLQKPIYSGTSSCGEVCSGDGEERDDCSGAGRRAGDGVGEYFDEGIPPGRR